MKHVDLKLRDGITRSLGRVQRVFMLFDIDCSILPPLHHQHSNRRNHLAVL